MEDFSLIGNVVNLASRLESRAPPGGLVIDRFTHIDAGEDFLDVRDLGRNQFKGFEELIQVFAVRGFADPAETEEMQRFLIEEFFDELLLEQLSRSPDMTSSDQQRLLANLHPVE